MKEHKVTIVDAETHDVLDTILVDLSGADSMEDAREMVEEELERWCAAYGWDIKDVYAD